MGSQRFAKNFVTYKARKSGDGTAAQWSLSSKRDCVFLEIAPQNGITDGPNAKFDWDNKLPFKMGESDIGEMLAVLAGLQPAVGPVDSNTGKHKGLFHSNANGNAILKFGKDNNGIYHMHLSVKRDKNVSSLRHMMSKGEACILATLLRQAVLVMYEWKSLSQT